MMRKITAFIAESNSAVQESVKENPWWESGEIT
jgi:hypothetical protein